MNLLKFLRARTSFRDLLITGWLIIFTITVLVVLFHPAYNVDGLGDILRLIGIPAVGTAGGVLLTRFATRLAFASPRARRSAMLAFIACMFALIPVMYVTFAMPWAILIVLSLLYVRWQWAISTTSQQSGSQ